MVTPRGEVAVNTCAGRSVKVRRRIILAEAWRGVMIFDATIPAFHEVIGILELPRHVISGICHLLRCQYTYRL